MFLCEPNFLNVVGGVGWGRVGRDVFAYGRELLSLLFLYYPAIWLPSELNKCSNTCRKVARPIVRV